MAIFKKKAEWKLGMRERRESRVNMARAGKQERTVQMLRQPEIESRAQERARDGKNIAREWRARENSTVAGLQEG